MATCSNEDEFVTCGICMNEYNEDTRKPKLLSCSHTVCLSCLQVKPLNLSVIQW